jgi:hypothetical protein
MSNANDQSNENDFISIQAQQSNGTWITFQQAQSVPLQIRQGMEQVKWQFPDKRVRAVDSNGRLVDML